MEKKERFIKKKVKKAVLTTTAVASLLVNNAYDSPFEIIDDTGEETMQQDEDERNEKKTFKKALQKYLGKLPIMVRIFVLFPLWFVGYLLMGILTPLYELFVAPYLGQISYWATFILFFLVLAFIATVFIFPGLPLSKTFNKKRIKWMVIALITLAVINEALPNYYPEYKNYSMATKGVTVFVILGLLILDCYIKNRKVRITASTDLLSISSDDI